MAYLCILSLGSRKHLKDFFAFSLVNERSATKSCSYDFVTLPRWSTLLVRSGEGDLVTMCWMTMAPESTTGESEKTCPASGTRGEENHFGIAGERSDDFRYGFPSTGCLWHSSRSQCLSQQFETTTLMDYAIIHSLINILSIIHFTNNYEFSCSNYSDKTRKA